MIKSTKFVQDLIKLTNRKTAYSNKYPNNIGLVHSDMTRTFDCWNLIKSLLNGYNIEICDVGYKCPTLSITGDVDGLGLLRKCTETSKDFKKLKEYPAGTYLFIANNHAGIYIGNYEIDGKTYNVVECTASWEKCVLLSYVDEDGTRRHYKGSRANGKWTDFGLLTPYVEYEEYDISDPCENPSVDVPEAPLYNLYYGSKGSEVSKLQRCLNFLRYEDYNGESLVVDGEFGLKTKSALIKFQRENRLVTDGKYGPLSRAALKIQLKRG